MDMEKKKVNELIQQLFAKFEDLIPQYMEDSLDREISNGNVAACLIESDGQVHGKLYGKNLIRSRESFRVAWTKASQVWITGMKTMEYEKHFFNNTLDGKKFGIEAPDLIGWEGGQPLTLRDGTVLSVGFSGFRGVSDIEIVIKALQAVESKS
jgi:glc operon protein GlcG